MKKQLQPPKGVVSVQHRYCMNFMSALYGLAWLNTPLTVNTNKISIYSLFALLGISQHIMVISNKVSGIRYCRLSCFMIVLVFIHLKRNQIADCAHTSRMFHPKWKYKFCKHSDLHTDRSCLQSIVRCALCTRSLIQKGKGIK